MISLVKMEPKSKNAEEEWIDTANELFRLMMQIRELQDRKKDLSFKLQGLSGYQTTRKGRYQYKLSFRKGAVNYSKIPELQGIDLEPYRKDDVGVWKLEVIE